VFEVSKQALQVCAQVSKSSWRKYLTHLAEFIRKEWTVGIPLGEFTNYHEPLDLRKVQGRYSDVFPKGSKLRRGGAIDQDPEGHWIHTHIVDRGFVSQSSKLFQQES
jgi:hypothetical protein